MSVAFEDIFPGQVNPLINTALAGKAALASPAFTGTPTAPTAALGTNSTAIATTAFVATAVGNSSTTSPPDTSLKAWEIIRDKALIDGLALPHKGVWSVDYGTLLIDDGATDAMAGSQPLKLGLDAAIAAANGGPVNYTIDGEVRTITTGLRPVANDLTISIRGMLINGAISSSRGTPANIANMDTTRYTNLRIIGYPGNLVTAGTRETENGAKRSGLWARNVDGFWMLGINFGQRVLGVAPSTFTSGIFSGFTFQGTGVTAGRVGYCRILETAPLVSGLDGFHLVGQNSDWDFFNNYSASVDDAFSLTHEGGIGGIMDGVRCVDSTLISTGYSAVKMHITSTAPAGSITRNVELRNNVCRISETVRGAPLKIQNDRPADCTSGPVTLSGNIWKIDQISASFEEGASMQVYNTTGFKMNGDWTIGRTGHAYRFGDNSAPLAGPCSGINVRAWHTDTVAPRYADFAVFPIGTTSVDFAVYLVDSDGKYLGKSAKYGRTTGEGPLSAAVTVVMATDTSIPTGTQMVPLSMVNKIKQ
jgi:hypothetical protein